MKKSIYKAYTLIIALGGVCCMVPVTGYFVRSEVMYIESAIANIAVVSFVFMTLVEVIAHIANIRRLYNTSSNVFEYEEAYEQATQDISGRFVAAIACSLLSLLLTITFFIYEGSAISGVLTPVILFAGTLELWMISRGITFIGVKIADRFIQCDKK